jgi:hypothetical protein
MPVSTLASPGSEYSSQRRPHTAGALRPVTSARNFARTTHPLLTKSSANFEGPVSAGASSSEAPCRGHLRQRPQTAVFPTPQEKRERMKAFTPPRPKALEPGLTVRGLGHFHV